MLNLEDKLMSLLESKLKINNCNYKLCSLNTKCYFDNYNDNWSCSYRTTRILLSSLFTGDFTIQQLQGYLEKSWNAGFDPEGILFHKIVCNYRMNVVDIASIFGFMGIKVRFYDFHEPTELIFDIIVNYFKSGYKYPIHVSRGGNLPHAIVVLGIVEDKLIIFDPNEYIPINEIDLNYMIKDKSFFNEKQYSVLFIEGKILTKEDLEISKGLLRSMSLPLIDSITNLPREQHLLLPIDLKNNYLFNSKDEFT